MRTTTDQESGYNRAAIAPTTVELQAPPDDSAPLVMKPANLFPQQPAELHSGSPAQYARGLIEASLDPLVTISPGGRLVDVNEGAIRVTGVQREALIGTDFCDYFTEPEKARQAYKQVFSAGFVTDYPLTMRRLDGGRTDVLYTASLYKDVGGNVLGVFAAARDVTEQRKAEAEVAVRRTQELERLAELERFQRLTVGRELKMIELKKEIEDLKKQLPPVRSAP